MQKATQFEMLYFLNKTITQNREEKKNS